MLEIWIWGGIMALSLLIEFISTDMISIWFTFGALVGLILAACNVALWIQIVVVVAISLICLIAFRGLVLKWFNKGEIKTNVDSLIGQNVTLLDDITKNSLGTVKISGITWNVVSDVNIKKGKVVTITEILGNKLKVVPIVKEEKSHLAVETVSKVDEKNSSIETIKDTNIEASKAATKPTKKINKK